MSGIGRAYGMVDQTNVSGCGGVQMDVHNLKMVDPCTQAGQGDESRQYRWHLCYREAKKLRNEIA